MSEIVLTPFEAYRLADLENARRAAEADLRRVQDATGALAERVAKRSGLDSPADLAGSSFRIDREKERVLLVLAEKGPADGVAPAEVPGGE